MARGTAYVQELPGYVLCSYGNITSMMAIFWPTGLIKSNTSLDLFLPCMCHSGKGFNLKFSKISFKVTGVKISKFNNL